MSERSLPFDKLSIVGETNADANILVLLDDMSGYNLVILSSGSVPNLTKYYNKGCVLINQVNGTIYTNTGSVTSCTFTQVTGNGASGTSSATGTSGTSGATGASGTSGTSGTSGKSGTSGL